MSTNKTTAPSLKSSSAISGERPPERKKARRDQGATVVAAGPPAASPPPRPAAPVAKAAPAAYCSSASSADAYSCKHCKVTGLTLAFASQPGPHHRSAEGGTRPCPRHSESADSTISALEKELEDKKSKIRAVIRDEGEAYLRSLEERKKALLADAQRRCVEMKRKVLEATPKSIACGRCRTAIKVPAGRCVGESAIGPAGPECAKVVCRDCLGKVPDCRKCSCCGSITNFVFEKCTEKAGKWFQFSYCREDCGFLCPEHTRSMECCVCSFCDFCNGPKRKCKIDTSGRCGRGLCSRCDIKEGCMCIEPGYSRFDFY